MHRKSLSACVILVALTLWPVGPASAVEYESGYRSCAGLGEQVVVTYGRTKGYAKHVQNELFKNFGWSAGWRNTSWDRGARTANWRVSGSVDLDGGYTRASCPG